LGTKDDATDLKKQTRKQLEEGPKRKKGECLQSGRGVEWGSAKSSKKKNTTKKKKAGKETNVNTRQRLGGLEEGDWVVEL